MPGAVPTTAEIGSILDQAGAPPWGWIERVRELGEVVWDHRADAWLVTSYAAVREMTRSDIEVFARPEQASGCPEAGIETPPPGADPQEWGDLVERMYRFRAGVNRTMELTMLGGKEHDHQHRWWMRALSPRVLEEWRESVVRPLAQEQFDYIAGRGAVELGAELVDPMVPRMIAGIMGEPTDRDWVASHAKRAEQTVELRLRYIDKSVDADVMKTAVLAGEGIHETLRPIIEAKRDGTSNDIVGMIWRDADNFFEPDTYGQYTDDDVIALAVNIGRAGVNTVASAVRNLLYVMLDEPDLQAAARADGIETIQRLSEESLRLYGPVDLRPRVAMEDVELGGVMIKAGDSVLGLRIAASRDGAKYGCPASIDLNRSAPRDHFSFYKGPRACPGQSLARMIMEEILSVAFNRTEFLRPDPDRPPPRYTGLVVRRWDPLHALAGR